MKYVIKNSDQYLKFKHNNNFRYIVYTRKNKEQYNNVIPKEVNILGENCFGNSSFFGNIVSNIKEIDISSKIIALSNKCFYKCSTLSSINLLKLLTSFGNECFKKYNKLKGMIYGSDYCSDIPI